MLCSLNYSSFFSLFFLAQYSTAFIIFLIQNQKKILAPWPLWKEKFGDLKHVYFDLMKMQPMLFILINTYEQNWYIPQWFYIITKHFNVSWGLFQDLSDERQTVAWTGWQHPGKRVARSVAYTRGNVLHHGRQHRTGRSFYFSARLVICLCLRADVSDSLGFALWYSVLLPPISAFSFKICIILLQTCPLSCPKLLSFVCFTLRFRSLSIFSSQNCFEV